MTELLIPDPAQHDLDVLTAAHRIKTGATREALIESAEGWLADAKQYAAECRSSVKAYECNLQYVVDCLGRAEAALREAKSK